MIFGVLLILWVINSTIGKITPNKNGLIFLWMKTHEMSFILFFFFSKYSLTCIKMALKGTWKCALCEQLPFIYKLKLYTLCIYGENETVLYRHVQ